MEISTADPAVQIAPRLTLNEAPPTLEPDLEAISKQVAVCKLQPFQMQKPSFSLTAVEQRAMPVKQKYHKSYSLVILWFSYMVLGPAHLLCREEVKYDIDLAKKASLTKFQGHTEDRLPPINLVRGWVEWHNSKVGIQARGNLPQSLREGPLRGGFSACSRITALLPAELPDTDPGMIMSIADLFLHSAPWLTARSAPTLPATCPDYSFRSMRVSKCRLQPTQDKSYAWALILLAACFRYKQYVISKALQQQPQTLVPCPAFALIEQPVADTAGVPQAPPRWRRKRPVARIIGFCSFIDRNNEWCGATCVRRHEADYMHRGHCRCAVHCRNRTN
jgi:hypothetical protein